MLLKRAIIPPLTDAIVALTTYANTVTGASDATLSDAVETLADGYGSGGGGLELLDEIIASSQNGIQVTIDPDWFVHSANILMIPDLTASASDWLYCNKDSTSGGGYTGSHASFGSEYLFMIHKGTDNKYTAAWFNHPETSGGAYTLNAITTYLYLYLYNSSHKLTGSLKIYGITI